MGRLAELQRKNLELLLGPDVMGVVQSTMSMWDPAACRAFTTGLCPNDLFTNTKMDLGSCTRTHSVKVKNDFTVAMNNAVAAKDDNKVAELNRLKVEYEQAIHQFVDECDRRIRAAQRRLEKTPEENNRTTALMREIGELEGAYQSAMAEVEGLGSEGKVEESMAQLTKAEALKSEKVEKERELQNLTDTSGASGHQKLRVCDICGAYLSVLDSDRRLADHFGGKMHLGYLQLRQLMDEWRTRGPLPTASSAPAPKPVSAVKVEPKEIEAVAPVAFRPIPASMKVGHSGPPPPTFVAATASSGERESGKESTRDSTRDSGRDSGRDRERERDPRDRDHRSSRSGADERDRGSSSRREGEYRSSSSRYDERDSGHRSSSRRHEDEDSSRHRSSRRDDDERSSRRDDEKPSSRRTLEEGEEREDKDKRRRVD